MAKLQRLDVSDFAKNCPPLDKSLFICSASYETRSLSIPLRIDPQQIAASVVCVNDNHLVKNKGHLDQLVSHFGEKAHIARFHSDDPVSSADSLKHELISCSIHDKEFVVVDATTFTHEGLLILLKILQIELTIVQKIYVAYSIAAEYSVGLTEQEKWLSRGIRDIRSVLGYPGDIRAALPTHLIVLVGFEADRARMLIDAYEPSAVSLGVGSDSTANRSEFIVTNLRTRKLVAESYSNFNEFQFSCTDFDITRQAVERQSALLPEHNVVVAPLNTKLSTIGCALAAFNNDSIQLCYASANAYNTSSYSRASDQCLLGELNLPFKST